MSGGCLAGHGLVGLLLTWRYWWTPDVVFWDIGWTTRAEVVAGGLQAALVGDDIFWWTPDVVVECQWSLARSRPSDLLVDAPRSERGNLVGVVLRSVWSSGPSHTWHGFVILEFGFSLGGFVVSIPPLQDLLTLGWMWPRSRVGESACVLRAFDLSSQGVHIPPEARLRPGQGRRTCPGLGGIGSRSNRREAGSYTWTTVSPGGVECRFHRLGLAYLD